MLELELFYKIVESAIRGKHIKYLKMQKCPSATAETVVVKEDEEIEDDFPTGEKIEYVKRFNKGIDTALKVLQSEFKRFSGRVKREEREASKF